MNLGEVFGAVLAALAVLVLGLRIALMRRSNLRGGGRDRAIEQDAQARQASVRELATARGWRTAVGAEAAQRTFPTHLVAELVTPRTCDLVIDGRGESFTAQSWSATERRVGAAASYGTRQHILSVPAPSSGVSLAVSSMPGLHEPMLQPAQFKGRMDQGVPGHTLAGGDYARVKDRLAPMLSRILDGDGWVVVADGAVTVTSCVEPDAQEFARRLALARDVAACLA